VIEIKPFVFPGLRSRVIFGHGTVAQTSAEIERLGRKRALVLSTPNQKAEAEALAGRLNSLSGGVFAEATMHTPVDVTEKALAAYEASAADCVVALGGGSTTGLGKAIATRTGADQVVIPTTYAGSEMTDILGETAGGEKTTRRDPSILPETVIYDVDLTRTLPPALTVTSGLNAMAHAAEALYAPDRNPIISLMAADAIRALCHALPVIARNPDDRDARLGPLRRLAVRRGVGRNVDGSASQALPHARRQLRYAARRNPRDPSPAHSRVQFSQSVEPARADFAGPGWNARGGALRLRCISPRAGETQGSWGERDRSRPRGQHRGQESILESASLRSREHSRPSAGRLGRTATAVIDRRL
jgi:hypothetical protein